MKNLALYIGIGIIALSLSYESVTRSIYDTPEELVAFEQKFLPDSMVSYHLMKLNNEEIK